MAPPSRAAASSRSTASLSPTGAPVLRDQLSAVDILQIEAPKGTDEARLAVEIRNALLFDFTGGGVRPRPTHRLKIAMQSTRASVIVDINTSRPDIENYGINATYSLTEIAPARSWSPVRPSPACPTTFPASSSASRACAACAMRRTRAAKVIADNITSRLASYFVAGT